MTNKEVLVYKERLVIKQELEGLALELNNDKEVDWLDDCQRRYYLCYNCYFHILSLGSQSDHPHESTTYCLSIDFLDEAKKRIGEERLLKLFEIKKKENE